METFLEVQRRQQYRREINQDKVKREKNIAMKNKRRPRRLSLTYLFQNAS